MDNYYDYREVPAEDPHLRRLLDCQYTQDFEDYCEACKFRAHGSSRPTANCWPSIREKMHCFQAYMQGQTNVPTQHDYSGQLSTACSTLCDIKGLMETHETPDYSLQLSSMCDLLSKLDDKAGIQVQELSAIEAVSEGEDVDESTLESELFKKLERLARLISSGFNTSNMTADEWLKLFVVAKMLDTKK